MPRSATRSNVIEFRKSPRDQIAELADRLSDFADKSNAASERSARAHKRWKDVLNRLREIKDEPRKFRGRMLGLNDPFGIEPGGDKTLDVCDDCPGTYQVGCKVPCALACAEMDFDEGKDTPLAFHFAPDEEEGDE